MKKVLLTVLIIVVLIITFIGFDIKKNINGEVTSVGFENVNIGVNTTTDINLKFKISNFSLFQYTVKKLNVSIFNGATMQLISQSETVEQLVIKKGVYEYSLVLPNQNIVSLANTLLAETQSYLVKVSFKILGIKVKFEQTINF